MRFVKARTLIVAEDLTQQQLVLIVNTNILTSETAAETEWYEWSISRVKSRTWLRSNEDIADGELMSLQTILKFWMRNWKSHDLKSNL